MRYHVFISYCRENMATAKELEDRLRGQQLITWRDDRINWGARYYVEIKRAIEESQALVVLVSPQACESNWVRREVKHALAQNVPVLPVTIEADCVTGKLEPMLQPFNRLHCGAGRLDVELPRIVKALEQAGVGSLSDPLDTQLNLDRLAGSFYGLGDEDTRQRLEALTVVNRQHLGGTPSGSFATVHGLRHTNAVLGLLGQLVPEEWRAHKETAFCLASAACLHDTGLVDLQFVREGKAPRVSKDGRRNHHDYARGVVHSLVGEAELTGAETDLIADLCYYHNWVTNPQQRALKPNRSALVSYFRLANACDLGPARAPLSWWQYNCGKLEGGEGEGAAEQAAARFFWLKNLLVESVDLDVEARRVVLNARVPGKAFRFLPERVHLNLLRSMDRLMPFIGPWHVEVETSEVDAESFGMDLTETVRVGALLCADPAAIVASSGDIADYFINATVALGDEYGHQGGKDAERAETVLRGLSDELAARRPELHALQHLRDRYQSAASKGGPGEKLLQARQALAGIHGQHRLYPAAPKATAFSRLAHHAYKHLLEIAGDRGEYRFLLFGYSGPVSVFLQYCLAAGKQLVLLTPTMRPVGEGPTLQVVTHLGEAEGVRVEVVPDAAVPAVLSGLARPEDSQRAARTPPERCDAVLMGCEALLPSGETILAGKTDVANSLGCVAIAQLADAARVPLWVLTESLKADGDPKISCWIQNRSDPPVGKVAVSAFHHEAAASQASDKSAACYPRSEVIPATLVKAIITEEGPIAL